MSDDTRGTCDEPPTPPDLVAWVSAPSFATVVQDPYPQRDLTAHLTALQLVHRDGALDELGPCAPSFEGGTAGGGYAGTCWVEAGTTAPTSPPVCGDVDVVGGGGCSTAGAPTLTLALASVLLWRRLGLCSLLGLSLPAVAADTLPQSSPVPGAWRYVPDAPAWVPWAVRGRVSGGWRSAPVVVRLPTGEGAPVLDGVGVAEGAVSLDLHRVARLTVGLPLLVPRAGAGAVWVDDEQVVDGPRGGDVLLALSAPVVRTRDNHHLLLVGARADLPTRPGTAWVAGPSFLLDVSYRYSQPYLSAGATLGVLTARKDAPTALTWGAAVEGRWRALGVGAEVSGQVGFVGKDAPEEGPWDPTVFVGTVSGRVHDALTVRGWAGAGLTRGIGAPRWEAGLTLDVGTGGTRDHDADGLADLIDRCPRVPEDTDGWKDTDGCPDPDNDVDLVLDADDVCPDVAEVPNGHADEDGCPDGRLVLTLVVVGPSPDGEEPTVRVDGRRVVADERAGPLTYTVALDAGLRHTLAVDADGFLPWSALTDVRVLDDADHRETRTVTLTAAPASGDTAVALPHPTGPDVVVDFAVGVAEPDVLQAGALDFVATWLRANPQVALLRVEGAADATGSSRDNYALSLARAEAVKAALVARGIEPTRLITTGTGEWHEGEGVPARAVTFRVLVWDDPAPVPVVP